MRMREKLTSNVIHEIGSSSGIAVLLINFKLSNSSSNSKVKMAPGGVQVPTIKRCSIWRGRMVGVERAQMYQSLFYRAATSPPDIMGSQTLSGSNNIKLQIYYEREKGFYELRSL